MFDNMKYFNILLFLIVILGIIIFIDNREVKQTENMLFIEEKDDEHLFYDNMVENIDIIENIIPVVGDVDDTVLEESKDNDIDFLYVDDSNENEVIDYFEFIENNIENSDGFKEKFKDYFISIIDFIFYDTEINGYTFSELSDSAKVYVISVALKIDSKIEEYIPNYKEYISTTSGNLYVNIKEKLVTLYMDISSDICNNNDDDCIKVKKIFSEIKDNCKIGWDFVKGLLSGRITKLKKWYEVYSGK